MNSVNLGEKSCPENVYTSALRCAGNLGKCHLINVCRFKGAFISAGKNVCVLGSPEEFRSPEPEGTRSQREEIACV